MGQGSTLPKVRNGLGRLYEGHVPTISFIGQNFQL